MSTVVRMYFVMEGMAALYENSESTYCGCILQDF